MFKCKVLSVLSACLLLSACASVSESYNEPNDASSVATIQGTRVVTSLVNWRTTTIDSIDNKSVSHFWSGNPLLKLAPGSHQLVVKAVFKRGLMNGPYYALIEIPFTAIANQHYLIQSSVEGKYINAWVVDSNKKTISPIVKEGYQILPSDDVSVIMVN